MQAFFKCSNSDNRNWVLIGFFNVEAHISLLQKEKMRQNTNKSV